MSGETQVAEKLVAEAMATVDQDPKQDRNAMGRALILATLERLMQDRPLSDVVSEMEYLLENLDEDDFVITRGC